MPPVIHELDVSKKIRIVQLARFRSGDLCMGHRSHRIKKKVGLETLKPLLFQYYALDGAERAVKIPRSGGPTWMDINIIIIWSIWM
jgi:hypothetical protein